MSEANIALIQQMYAAFGRGDIPAIIEALTADVDWQTFGNPQDFPTFGQRVGKSAVREFFDQVAANEQFTEFTPREFYAADDMVIALGSYAGRIKKTGHPIACEWAHVFTVAGGKVSRFREYTDTAQFFAGYRG